MNENSPKITKKTPKSYLEEILNDPGMPANIKADAAKALLPYTAKKTTETIESKNYTYFTQLDDQRLKALSDDELEQLISLIRKCQSPVDSNPGEGVEEAEVQHD